MDSCGSAGIRQLVRTKFDEFIEKNQVLIEAEILKSWKKINNLLFYKQLSTSGIYDEINKFFSNESDKNYTEITLSYQTYSYNTKWWWFK